MKTWKASIVEYSTHTSPQPPLAPAVFHFLHLILSRCVNGIQVVRNRQYREQREVLRDPVSPKHQCALTQFEPLSDGADTFAALSPDQTTLVLRGNEEEASSVLLQGTLVLCLAEPLKVQNIRLRFTGERKKKVNRFFRKNWSFEPPGLSRGGTLAADNYEWPFDYVLSGNTPESVEGLDDSWIVYRMKATVDRGVLAQNIVTRKHIRVIRALDTAALELSHMLLVENTWHKKIDYTISTPTKAVIFGTTIDVDFRIAPMLKGLKIGEVITSLIETQDLWMDPKYPERKKGTVTRLIAEDRYNFPQDQETELVNAYDAWAVAWFHPTHGIQAPATIRPRPCHGKNQMRI
ncbi:MAG: hypothetical protein Q9169_000770 [Polycauliona sp. 2 TL-2023]